MPTVGDGAGWTHDPWGAELGTTASMFTFVYSHELRDELHGRLTLSAVSD